ncbi:uncharacterized protein LOC109727203 isoform X2 [Ananas comosus]|uniref:Uncharacterized protein LOC109727203 isoform X2 n=1 Tax=Ananas comosus TaxID=4615 RepID=A0A6P5GYA2_ANACO|nr:uncharacterized protein LOC109727203 isoform X2 [Ananas comosus]
MACTTTFHFPCARSTSPSFNFNQYNPSNPSSATPHSRTKTSVKSRASAFPTGSIRLELDENPEGIISGEWPENFSLLSYDDLRVYLESQAPSENDQSRRLAVLSSVMSSPVWTAKAEQTLEEINHHFDCISGIPVVDGELQCVGIISKKDKAKASNGLRTRIGEMMTTPVITLPAEKTVTDAAALMLKRKIHRIPIVNDKNQVIGIVTRTDVLRGLEALLV